MQRISVLSPATVANLVCGFDILGLALEEPSDLMILEKTDEPGLSIINLDDYGLPTDPEKNVAGVALLSLMDAMDNCPGLQLSIEKRIKPGSGIGSSAASAAGAVAAANMLFGEPLRLWNWCSSL